MKKPVLVTTSTFGAGDAEPRRLLDGAGLDVRLNPFKRKLTEAEVLALLAEHKPVGILAGVEPLTSRVLEAARGHLRIVSRCGAGLESVDLAAAGRLGMKVLSTPDAPSPAVAELAVALMLDALRKVSQADRNLRAGRWQSLPGGLLGCRTVGVVGFGRIGSRVAALCRAFGCKILVCEERPVAQDWAEQAPLDELLKRSDVVTLHVPLLPSTRGLISAAKLALMKKHSVLINVSRGGLVDEAALEAALRNGALAAAGLDVFEQEPYQGPLSKLENAVLTCHMGSAAAECRSRMEKEAAENLIEGLRAAGELS